MKIHENIRKKRKEKGMTQEELASYLGISTPAVNKWEKGLSFPDITFLPCLAALFNMSVDDLLGYEPQLTKEEIRAVYRKMSARFSKEPFEAVMEDLQDYMKKYAACFPFLYQMAALLLNYYTLSKNPQETMAYIISLADKVEKESGDVYLARDAREMKLICYLQMGDAQEVLEMTDETIRPLSQEYFYIAAAWEMKGNTGKAKEIMQVCAYQHLVLLLAYTTGLIRLEKAYSRQAEEMIERNDKLIELFSMQKLQFNETEKFYLTAAVYYCVCGKKEEALHMLDKYVACAVRQEYPLRLHGDTYFDCIDRWIEELTLGEDAPRSEQMIKESLNHELSNPAFDCLKGEKKFENLKEKLKTHL